MLERLQSVKYFAVIAGFCFANGVQSAELTIGDLKNPMRVVESLQNSKLTDIQAKQLTTAVTQGLTAFEAKRYGPAYKAWALAALTLPNSANLVMMAESILREVGEGNNEAYKAQRRKSTLPDVLVLYESALAAEKAKPLLGNISILVAAHHACLKLYVEKQTVVASCGPLIWSGASKI